MLRCAAKCAIVCFVACKAVTLSVGGGGERGGGGGGGGGGGTVPGRETSCPLGMRCASPMVGVRPMSAGPCPV